MEGPGNDKKVPVTKEIPAHAEGGKTDPVGSDRQIAAVNDAGQAPCDPKEVAELQRILVAAEAYHTNKDMESLRGDLNYLRAYCQDLRNSSNKLKRIFAEIKIYSPETCGEIKEFSEFLFIYPGNKEVIEKTLVIIRERIKDNGTVSDYFADQIADIECCWTRILYCAYDIDKKPLDGVKDSLKEIDTKLCDLIAYCDQITIPIRLNQHLQNMRIGQQLNFYDRFKDEFCSKAEGKFILDYISKQPNVVHGIIDVDSGIVYNASPDKGRQYLTYFITLILMIFGGLFLTWVIVPYLTQSIPELRIANADPLMYLAAYIFVMLGGCVHVLLDIIKERQSAASKLRISITDWILWGHINEISIYIAIFMLIVGFFGLVWIRQIDIVTAFAVGYSIDSVYDVIVARFDKGVTTRSSEIVKVIKG